MHASDFQENDTAHEYYADNPDFPAKTIVATLFIGAFFGYLNDTLLNVALTPIMKDFGVDKTTVQWLTTGFLLVMGAFTPITAGVIQWFETRKMVLFTQATFLAGSMICAFAPTFGILVVGRMVQAVSAAFFVPLLFNGILSIYPPNKRGTAMGVITMMFTAAPAMGPTLSGIIIDHTHWRVLFGFTAPFMLAAMLLVGKYLTVNLSNISRPKIDVLSAVLSVAGFGGLVYAGSNFAHLPLVEFILLFAASVLLVGWFAHRQFRLATPLLNLRAFEYKQFRQTVQILRCDFGWCDIPVLGLGADGADVHAASVDADRYGNRPDPDACQYCPSSCRAVVRQIVGQKRRTFCRLAGNSDAGGVAGSIVAVFAD